MAATVGATLASVTFPLRHAGIGPFKSSAGNIYTFQRVSATPGSLQASKATDPMSSFTSPVAAKLFSTGTSTAIEAVACYQVADVIHVVGQIATGQVFYNQWSMATDTWTLGASETAVAAASFAPTVNHTFVSLAVRSTGEVVAAYCAGVTAMSGTFNMVRYIRRTGVSTWTGATNIDNGGSIDWSGAAAGLGDSDRVHFFFTNQTSAIHYQRTLSAANALQTFPATFDASSGVVNLHNGIPNSYVSGGVTKVVYPYRRSAGGFTRGGLARLNSADAPTVSNDGDVTDVNIAAATAVQNAVFAVVDGSTVHYLYANVTDVDLYRDTDGGAATWGTDALELAGNILRISANVYDRSGTKLAMVVDDNGTIKYAEISLAATPASLLFQTNDVLTQLRRR